MRSDPSPAGEGAPLVEHPCRRENQSCRGSCRAPLLGLVQRRGAPRVIGGCHRAQDVRRAGQKRRSPRPHSAPREGRVASRAASCMKVDLPAPLRPSGPMREPGAGAGWMLLEDLASP